MRLLSNQSSDHHYDVLIHLLGRASKAWLFVAYLKESGLDRIEASLSGAVENGVHIELFCGLSQQLTDPRAIDRVSKIFEGTDCLLHVLDPRGRTFHPKLYCFFTKESEHLDIIVGSANLTKGALGGDGIGGNCEASLYLNVSLTDSLVKQIKEFRDDLSEQPQADLVRYREVWKISKEEHDRAARRAAKKIAKLPDFFFTREDLDNWITAFVDDPKAREDAHLRSERLNIAKEILKALCDGPLPTREGFLQQYSRLVGEKGQSDQRLWNPNGLFRGKNRVAERVDKFIHLVREVRKNIDMPPGDLFAMARGIVDSEGLKGLGPNILTLVMHTFDSRRFAVLNEKSLSSLSYLKPRGKLSFPQKAPGSMGRDDYRSFNSVAEELRDRYKLQDMSEVDNFLVFVHREKGKPPADVKQASASVANFV